MKAILSLVTMLLVLAVIGLLAKSQLGSTSKPIAASSAALGVSMPTTTPGANTQRQSQEIQQQVKQSIEAAMQPARAEPDDK